MRLLIVSDVAYSENEDTYWRGYCTMSFLRNNHEVNGGRVGSTEALPLTHIKHGGREDVGLQQLVREHVVRQTPTSAVTILNPAVN